MTAFVKILQFSKDIYTKLRHRACNFLLTLQQMEERCWSIMIPSKVSVVLVVSETTSIGILIEVFVLRSKRLLPGLALM